ncbi:MAG: atsA 3 [Verrucomicrobia bacterium]|jgi:arylsulfatase A-like enzyme|nr:atsA 3 [Verrucomicrobiota bacterium]
MKHWLIACLLALASAGSSIAAQKPNIVLIYADDLGYGDVSANGSKTIKTPNMDRIAKEGLRFTAGYATSATCTPSRYSLMTGEYAWRQKGTGILPGDAALIIKPGRTTLPSVLQKAGYKTGAVGKWHLGLGDKEIDWNGDIKPGPNEVGYDYSYIMAATADRVPCVFVENHRVVGLDPKDPIEVNYTKNFPGEPTGKENPELLTKQKPSHGHDMSIVNGISRIGFMKGGKAALWKDEDMADIFTGKAVQFIEKNKAQPFFLYFGLHDPHVPRVPHPRFVGKSGMGARGDAIIQADWCVGEVLNTLEKLRLNENTLVILSSDNGPVIDDGYQDEAVKLLGEHKPWGPYRGNKYSKFEAGTRVPFLVRWTGKIKPGVSDAMISQVDLLASFAALTGQTLAEADAPDSLNMLPALLGESKQGRDYVLEHANAVALRQGNWKFIEPSKGPKVNKNTNAETGNDEVPQLYDLSKDVGERKNVAAENPEKVQEMQAALNKFKQAGRTRP